MTRDEFLKRIEEMYYGRFRGAVRFDVPHGWMQFRYIADKTVEFTSSTRNKAPQLLVIKDIDSYVFSVFVNVYLASNAIYTEVLE